MAKILLLKTCKLDIFPYVVTPPLGLMYLASYMRQKYDHEIKILDMRLDYLKPAEAINEFVKFRPDIVGISNFTQESGTLHRLAKNIKEQNKRCQIIVGGPHATSCTDDVLKNPNIDCAVLGEGEETFSELVETILEGDSISKVRGIAFKRNGIRHTTPPRENIPDLDNLPFPAWDLIDIKKYFKHWRFNNMKPGPYMAIMTSRGCPYGCIFCHNMLGKKFRARSPENVFSEIKALYERYSIRDFEIIDDSFNLDKERAIKICDLIISSGLKIKLSFPNGVRGDLMDEELILKLRQAGTFLITYAPETGSARLQKTIKKNMDLDKLQEVIRKTSKAGIFTHGYFMIGFPTETKKDLDDTHEFLLQTRLNTAQFFIANPFPDTELYKLAVRMGKNTNIEFDSFTYVNPGFNLSGMNNEELFKTKRRLFMAFYLNPKRLFHLLMAHPNKRGILMYFLIFLRNAFFNKANVHTYLKFLHP
ncbi:MAG: cobalamin B12-binding domain-containing protein [Candidatus Omnitrophica bacterium]|nr:cobalamin B12-binding domain-containing protein [Candidatus Omnitrophota bacterium]